MFIVSYLSVLFLCFCSLNCMSVFSEGWVRERVLPEQPVYYFQGPYFIYQGENVIGLLGLGDYIQCGKGT